LNKFCSLLQFTLDSRNQCFTLTVHFVLGIEKGPSFLVALSFQGLDFGSSLFHVGKSNFSLPANR
jgi:hypothetical protein